MHDEPAHHHKQTPDSVTRNIDSRDLPTPDDRSGVWTREDFLHDLGRVSRRLADEKPPRERD